MAIGRSRFMNREVLAVVIVVAVVGSVAVVQYLLTPPRCGPSHLSDQGEPFCIPIPEMVFNSRNINRASDSYVLYVNISNPYWPYLVNLTQVTYNDSTLISFWPSAYYAGTVPPFSLRPNESTPFEVVFPDSPTGPAFKSGDMLNLGVVFDKNRSSTWYHIPVP